MNNIICAELKKFKTSKVKYAVLACFIPVIIMTLVYAFNPKYPTIRWDDYLTEIQTFLNMMVCMGVFGIITAYMFAFEFETKTINVLFTYPFKRVKILISKFITIFIIIVATLLLTFLSALICGMLVKHETLTLTIVSSHFIDFLQISLFQCMLTTIVAALTIKCKNMLPSLIFILAMTFFNIILMNTPIGIYFPWSIPVVLTPHSIGGRTTTNYALGYTAICIYFLISSFFSVKNFKYIHQ